MAISGAWKTKQQTGYSSPLRQGTGWNPVHAVRDQTGRGNAETPPETGVPVELIGDDVHNDDYGYTAEDYSSTLWGYGVETGTADRPSWGELNDRNTTNGYPTPGNKRAGLPGGSRIRAIDRGAATLTTAKQVMPDAAQGHDSKVATFGEIEESIVSDPSQYEMQTSMTQMEKSRSGSQRGGGSASQYDAPVTGKRPTMRQRRYVPSEKERHAEMMPYQQDLILRPFEFRTAGTGNPDWLAPNEMYQSQPLQRVPNADPYQGVPVPVTDQAGFMDEGWSI